ncbi:hypothetical protein BJY52DRAFT_1287573 [Lactarius psammicola]|nr:hypothetical protein BJY52DRAFT_1287573 [Lactarius psammicola]
MTLMPFWNETFDLLRHYYQSRIVQSQIYDQRRVQAVFKRNYRGFLRSVSINVGDILDRNQGRTGMPLTPSLFLAILLMHMYHSDVCYPEP